MRRARFARGVELSRAQSDLHGIAHFGHCLRGDGRGTSAPVFDDGIQTPRLLRQRRTYVPHRRETLHHPVGNKFLAVDTADGRLAAILVDLLDDRQRRKML